MTDDVTTHCRCDLLVLGGGPGGTAAAIHAAQKGASVVLFERANFPRHRPGETLHPGLEPLFEQLDIMAGVHDLDCVRHTGINVNWHGIDQFQAYSTQPNEDWYGFQIFRKDLDALLLAKARELGVIVFESCAPKTVCFDSKQQVCGVVVDGKGTFHAPWTVDATGNWRWLIRKLGLAAEAVSKQALYATYGYVEVPEHVVQPLPEITRNAQGWLWVAPITQSIWQWTQLSIGKKSAKAIPSILSEFDQHGSIYGADVSWRKAERFAGAGFFAVGDAAFALDPASSHGVLKAIISGIKAAESALNCSESNEEIQATVDDYQQWLEQWFDHDVQALRDLYAQISVDL